MSITTVMLACVHVEVAMLKHKLARRHSETQKHTRGKMINITTKETYEKHFASYSGL